MSEGRGADYALVDVNETFDPTQGLQRVETYEGTEPAIETLANAFITAGGRTSRLVQGGVNKLQVRWAADPTDPNTEVPNDNYVLEMEEVQPSIWTHPRVTDAANASPDGPYKFRKLIEDYVKDPINGSIPVGTELLVQYLLRGGHSFLSHQPVLSRQRTFSLRYTTKIKVTVYEQIYKTPALISHFAIPSGLAAQLPDDPPPSQGITPTGTVWAWKTRRQNSRYVPALNKVEEQVDWVFAAWADWVYSLVST